MKATDIIGNAMRQYGMPMDQALDRAVSMSKHDRAPKAVQKLHTDAVAIARTKPFEWPKGEMILSSGRTGHGKTFMVEQHMRALAAKGYTVQFTQTLEDPAGRITATRGDESPREWQIVEPKLYYGKPPQRRDYWGEALRSMYLRHSGPVDPDAILKV